MPDANNIGEEVGEDAVALRATIDRLQAELAHLKRGTHDFVAMLAHELRTPLGAILMWAHVLRLGRQTDREAALDAIETSANEQSRLIESLLDVTRALAGRLKIEQTVVDLGALVGSEVETLRGVATTTQVGITLTADQGTTFPVRGDARRLRAMIAALVKNAVLVTPAGGNVDIAVTNDTGLVCLSVTDGGLRFTGDEATAIFTPFLIAEGRGQRRAGSLGLDLPLAGLLAKLHHGTLTAQNRVGGEGRVFRLQLPDGGAARD